MNPLTFDKKTTDTNAPDNFPSWPLDTFPDCVLLTLLSRFGVRDLLHTWAWTWAVEGSSSSRFHPADPTQPRLAEKQNFRLPRSVFANQLPSPAKQAEQSAINYKEILSTCGRFATTPVSKANRYGELGCLVPCTAAMPNPGPTDPLTADQREGGGEVCYHAHCSIISHFIFTSWYGCKDGFPTQSAVRKINKLLTAW